MNDSFKKRIILFRQWLAGETNREAERSLERSAVEDPFLSDAMDGYRSMPEKDHVRDVTRIKSRLRKRTSKRQRGAIFYLTRAAAFGVVLLSAWMVFRAVQPQQENVIAESTEQDQQQVIPFERDEDSMQETARDKTANLELNEQARQNQGYGAVKKKDDPAEQPGSARIRAADEESEIADAASGHQTDTSRLQEGLALFDQKPAAAPPPEEPVAAEEARSAESEPVAKTQKLSVPEAESEPFMDLVEKKDTIVMIHGNVTGSDGEPIVGASIQVKGTDQGTVTGLRGDFSIVPLVDEPVLEISYLGYEKREVAVGERQFLQIPLSPSEESLSEVQVTTLRAPAKPRKESGPVAEPDGGFEAFEKYLDQFKEIPADVSGGMVELRFDIDGEGRPVRIKVLQSDCSVCEAEAIRLLEDGPDWRPASTQAVSLVINF